MSYTLILLEVLIGCRVPYVILGNEGIECKCRRLCAFFVVKVRNINVSTLSHKIRDIFCMTLGNIF